MKLKLNVIDPLRFQVGCFLNGCSPSDLIILSTITKTGTHYLRMAITLQLIFQNDDVIGEIEPTKIDKVFPNNYHNHYLFPKRVKHREQTGFKRPFMDLPRSHLPYQPAWSGTRVLHTFRHPINFITCLYLYKYNADPRYNIQDVPLELITETHLSKFEEEYNSHLKAWQKNQKKVYRINFDEFISDAPKKLEHVLNWIGMESDIGKCTQIHNYILKEYPNLYVGAGEAWMRNGKGCPSDLAMYQQEYFLKYDRFNYSSIWSKHLFDQVNELGLELGFKELCYE